MPLIASSSASPADSSASLARLRQAVAELDHSGSVGLAAMGEEEGLLPLGLPEIDAALGGGLALGAVHDLAPVAPAQLGAATGFALALAALNVRGGQALWIQTKFAGCEAGLPYGPGLDLLGLPMSCLLSLRVAHPRDALWAFEEALKCRALAAVLAELPEADAATDLTATRRLSLAARSGGGLGLLLRHRACAGASAATSRWEIAAAPSTPDRFGGIGRTAFELSLTRNRRGRIGRWIVHWNHHERSFVPQALSLGLAAAAGHGSPDPQPRARAG